MPVSKGNIYFLVGFNALNKITLSGTCSGVGIFPEIPVIRYWLEYIIDI